MRFRAIIAFSLSLLIAAASYAQGRWHATVLTGPTLSWLDVNKKSDKYDNRLDDVNLSFKGKGGFAAGLQGEYQLSEKFSLFAGVRYHQWGGQLYAIKNNPKFYLDLDITYRSIRLPLGIKYTLLEKGRIKCNLSGGMGIDRSYHVSFIPSNYYGSIPAMNHKTDITTSFLMIGVGTEYSISEKLTGIVSLEVNNDMLLNPNRMQDMGGNFVNTIPLSHTMVALLIGIKIYN
jgi:hypothetical protein